MAPSFQGQENPTGTPSFAAEHLPDMIDGANPDAAAILKTVAGDEQEGDTCRRLRFETRLSSMRCRAVLRVVPGGPPVQCEHEAPPFPRRTLAGRPAPDVVLVGIGPLPNLSTLLDSGLDEQLLDRRKAALATPFRAALDEGLPELERAE